MTTTNNPKNQQPHAGRDLAQIMKGTPIALFENWLDTEAAAACCELMDASDTKHHGATLGTAAKKAELIANITLCRGLLMQFAKSIV